MPSTSTAVLVDEPIDTEANRERGDTHWSWGVRMGDFQSSPRIASGCGLDPRATSERMVAGRHRSRFADEPKDRLLDEILGERPRRAASCGPASWDRY